MKKFFYFLIMVILGTVFCINCYAQENKNIKFSNKYFSIQIPENARGKYQVKKEKDRISIFDKSSKKAGYGGFAFGIKVYKNPADHAMMPGGTKVGELVDKKGTIYDVVLVQPTDVQCDYVKGCAESYYLLYNLADNIGENINGVKGSKYTYKGGTRGEDLYKDVLKKHLKALNEKWDSAKLEQENMSYMYTVLSRENDNLTDKIGYAYYDSNGDGIDELFIGEIAEGNYKGIVYDIYTMVDRTPAHVVSGGARNRYYVCNKTFICNEYSSGATESGWNIYILLDNSTELFPQIGFKYDEYTDKQNPWFLSYVFTEDIWESVSETKFKERKAVFEKYERFDYIPLSSLNDKEYNN